MNFLRRAQIMYERRPEKIRQEVEQKAADNYTLTMFYLAQVALGLPAKRLRASEVRLGTAA